MVSDWPPQLSQQQRSELLTLATLYALGNGLCYLPKPQTGLGDPGSAPGLAIHAPFTLFPSAVPRRLLAQAQRIQKTYNVLYSRIALDHIFLDRVMGAVQGVGRVDEFTGTLWKGWTAIRNTNKRYVEVCLTFARLICN